MPRLVDTRDARQMALCANAIAALRRQFSGVHDAESAFDRAGLGFRYVLFPGAVTSFATDSAFEKRGIGKSIQRGRERLQAARLAAQASRLHRTRQMEAVVVLISG